VDHEESKTKPPRKTRFRRVPELLKYAAITEQNKQLAKSGTFEEGDAKGEKRREPGRSIKPADIQNNP
jgi:hypothetical protein